MKKVLLPTDFSPHARNAARYASASFADEVVLFTLLHAYSLPFRSTEIMVSSMQDALDAESREQLTTELLHLKAERHHPDSRFEIVSEFGNVTQVINDYANRSQADYIVMGTRGASGLKAILVGSNTSALLRKTSCPVLAIPEAARYHGLKLITLAIDPRMPLPQHLETVTEFASRHKAHISVLAIADTQSEVDESAHQRHLDTLLKGVDYSSTMLYDTTVTTGIERYLNEHPVDLLVMFPGKDTLVDRVFHQSVTRKMALHSKVPLLTVKG